MQNNRTQILQSARVAELRTAAIEVAALCKRAAPVELSRLSSSARDRRLLLLLLARERRRNQKLVNLLGQ